MQCQIIITQIAFENISSEKFDVLPKTKQLKLRRLITSDHKWDPPSAPGGRGVVSTLALSSCHSRPMTSCADRMFTL